jgi:RNA polymerase sigma-70 factor (ECF subfamily)
MRDPITYLRDARLSRLVTRSQAGDREAFRALYRALHAPVSRYVWSRVTDRTEAEEVVAQVFLKLVEALPRVDAKRPVIAYAIGIARNALIDRAAGKARQDALVEEESAESAGALDALIAREELAALRQQLSGLPQEAQEILRLRYGDGLRFAEIAEMLQLNEAAVRQRASRAIRELRARLGAPENAAVAIHREDGAR